MLQKLKYKLLGMLLGLTASVIMAVIYVVFDPIFSPKFDFTKEGNIYEFDIDKSDIGKDFGVLFRLPKGEGLIKYGGCLQTNAKYKLEFFDGNVLIGTQIVEVLKPTKHRAAWCNDTKCYTPISTIENIAYKEKLKMRLTVLEPAFIFKVIKGMKTYFYTQKKPYFMKEEINITEYFKLLPLITEEEAKSKKEECSKVTLILDEETNGTLSNLREYIAQDNLEKVKEIINNGTSVNVKMNHDNTPLMFAAFHNSTKTMKYLLDNGADTEAKNAVDNRAILYAFGKKNTEAIKLLLEYNATLKEDDKVYPFVNGFSGVNPFGEQLPFIRFLMFTYYYDGIEIYLKYGLDVNYIQCNTSDNSKRYCHTLGDIKTYPMFYFNSKEEKEKIVHLINTYNAKTYEELINNQTNQGEDNGRD
jgi:hypothetical protein